MSPKKSTWLASPLAAVVAAIVLAVTACSRSGTDGRRAHGSEPAPTTPSRGSVQEVWRWNVPSPGSAGMPAVGGPDGRIAFTYGHMAVVLLDGAGNELWKADRIGVRDVAPSLTPTSVLVATDEGVAAFDPVAGRPLWDTDLTDRANTPALIGDVVVTTTWDGSLVGLDRGDGSVLWRVLLPGSAFGPPAVAALPPGQVTPGLAIATWDSGRRAGVTAVSAADGKAVWEVPLAPGGVSAPAVAPPAAPGPDIGSGTVVVVAGDLAAHGLSVADGREVWHAGLEGSGAAEVPPFVGTSGEVVAAHRLGGFSVLDPATGATRWSESSDGVAVRGGPVSTAGGRVAMALDDGRVLVAGSSTRSELRPAEGRVSGLAVTVQGALVVATRGLRGGGGAQTEPLAARGRRTGGAEAINGARPAALIAFTGW